MTPSREMLEEMFREGENHTEAFDQIMRLIEYCSTYDLETLKDDLPVYMRRAKERGE